jgi:hypothetical protein
MKAMNYSNVKAMMFQAEEIAILEKAELILREVQFRLGGDNTIMSLETGECIVPGDLATARGVLDFIRNYRMVEINPQ